MTVIVLIILAGVAVSMISGQDRILTRAGSAKIQSELAEYKEQIDMYIISKQMENVEFDEESLFAGKESLRYNTQSEDEEGNIKTICPQMKDSYLGKIEVKKGKMTLDTKDKTEIKIAQSLGIDVNPYEINEDGELAASPGNLLLIDSKGTLTLPDSITSIGAGAFANTASDGITLKKVIIPPTVKEIKENAFNGNTTIEEIEIQTKNGEGLTKIGSYAFAECSSLKSIILPDTVTEVGKDSFFNCTSLTDATLSDNMTEISREMFYGCTELKQIVIPKKVIVIRDGAFCKCSKLEMIKFSDGLNVIENYAFAGCEKLEDINIGNNLNFIFEKGILMDKNKTKMCYIIEATSNVNTFTIPDGIVSLDPGLLSTTTIKKIIIPASVSDILNDFFPKSVEDIEIDSENIKYMVSNGGIYSKDKKILYMYFGKEHEISIEDGVTEIGSKAFECASASTINLLNSVEKLDSYAIYNAGVKKVNIGSKINSISPTAFSSCSVDVNISTNENYTAENGLIYNKNKTSLVACVKSMENISIPDGVLDIGEYAFSGRTVLKNIAIPKTVKNIKKYAFFGCTILEEIEIPSSVTEIGENCFLRATKLKKIKINKPKGSISGSPWGNMYADRAIIWEEE